MQNRIHRRGFLEKSALAAGTAGLAAAGAAATSPAKSTAAEATAEERPAKNAMPYGTIGKLKISRLILGSNLMSGSAHDRDLIYVSGLMKAYNTDEKILDTLELAESLGVNTIWQGRPELVRKYNTERGGHMQQILPLRLEAGDDEPTVREKIRAVLGQGAAAMYVYGRSGDLLVRDGRVELIGKALDWAREAGAVIGIGGHSLRVVVDCEKHGLQPDFYFKTFHHDGYWSATPKEQRKDFCWYEGVKSDGRRDRETAAIRPPNRSKPRQERPRRKPAMRKPHVSWVTCPSTRLICQGLPVRSFAHVLVLSSKLSEVDSTLTSPTTGRGWGRGTGRRRRAGPGAGCRRSSRPGRGTTGKSRPSPRPR